MRETRIGIAEHVNFGVISARDRVREIVNFLPAVGSPARHEDIRAKTLQNRVSGIFDSFDNELDVVIAIVLVQDRLDIFLEPVIDAFAGAKHHDTSLT